MNEPLPRRRRRWFSTSLRGMMILVLIVGGTLGWKARKASIQRRGMARIAQLRGSVVYDWEYEGDIDLRSSAAHPPGPAWLRKIVGDEYFQEVTRVVLPTTITVKPKIGYGPGAREKWTEANRQFQETFVKPLADDQLACLEPFDRLEAVNLQQSFDLKPEALARLERLTRLKELSLGNNFNQDGLKQLGALKKLESLTFWIPEQGETDFSFLGEMPKLRSLFICGRSLNDEHMKQIGRVPELEMLTIFGERLTDAGLAYLKDARRLNSLSIMGGSDLTGDGLTALEGLTDLKFVWLTGFPMNRAGLDHLRKLPKLSNLNVSQRQLDAEALKDFKAARPGVTVSIAP